MDPDRRGQPVQNLMALLAAVILGNPSTNRNNHQRNHRRNLPPRLRGSRNNQWSTTISSQNERTAPERLCYYCNRPGHIANSCHIREQRRRQLFPPSEETMNKWRACHPFQSAATVNTTASSAPGAPSQMIREVNLQQPGTSSNLAPSGIQHRREMYLIDPSSSESEWEYSPPLPVRRLPPPSTVQAPAARAPRPATPGPSSVRDAPYPVLVRRSTSTGARQAIELYYRR